MNSIAATRPLEVAPASGMHVMHVASGATVAQSDLYSILMFD
jgi:hypothetical protein